MTLAAPADSASFRKSIEMRFSELSDRLRRVAGHVLNEPNDFAFETLAVIAQRCNVQPSTIVRFAQAFGFTGASQMQKMLRDDLLRDNEALGYAERVRQFGHAVQDGVDSPRQLLSEFAEGNILALQNLHHAISAQALAQATELLEQAATVYVVGFRRSFPVAVYFTYLLAQAGKRTILVDGIAGLQGQQARGMASTDLLVAISFSPYSPETTLTVEEAAAKRVPIIAISESVVSPIAQQARVVLQVRETEIRGFRSLSASMCLVQALAIAFATLATEEEAA
uniref:MurR/RpiR family transcriptional regulator n=1 Tax=uncultured Sphingomonas sp. TaxID=158754 RepID=UPI0035CA8903